MNQHRISENSIFSIKIHDATGLQTIGRYYIQFTVNRETKISSAAVVEQGKLTWTDHFDFKVITGQEQLSIEIVEADVAQINESSSSVPRNEMRELK
jgi:hypothetical protein